MAERHRVGLVAMHVNTPRDKEARAQLADALQGAEFTPIDEETGVFEAELEADSEDEAIVKVIDAIAAAGVDDHIMLAEHPPPRIS